MKDEGIAGDEMQATRLPLQELRMLGTPPAATGTENGD